MFGICSDTFVSFCKGSFKDAFSFTAASARTKWRVKADETREDDGVTKAEPVPATRNSTADVNFMVKQGNLEK